MSLKIIGAGFGRTGTFSIKLALEALGFGPCHHMEEVFTNPAQLPYWRSAVNGDAVDWEAAFSGYESCIDWPSTHYWRELSEFYPDARILLSQRPPERWWQSFSGTIKKLLETKDSIADDYLRSILDKAYEMIASQTFGGHMQDRDAVLAAYRQRIDDVCAAIPAERLLVYEVTEGWAPLCEFLDVPQPQQEFPRANNQQEFWQIFGGA